MNIFWGIIFATLCLVFLRDGLTTNGPISRVYLILAVLDAVAALYYIIGYFYDPAA